MKKHLTILLLGVALAAPSVAQTAEDLFQQALREERVAGNTEAAIRLYRQIVADRSADRAVVARSLLQMGKAYEALGRDGASSAYARIVNEFGDFASIAAEASSRMAGLRRETQAAAEPEAGSIGTIRLKQGAAGAGMFMSISPDGEFILVSSAVSTRSPRRTIVLQEVRTGIVDSLQAANEACQANTALFSPDGNELVMDCAEEKDGNDILVFVYDRRTASARRVFSALDYLSRELPGFYTRVWGWSEDGTGIIVDVMYFSATRYELHHRLLVPTAGGPAKVLEDDLADSNFDEDPICSLRDGRFLFGEYGSDLTPQRRVAIHRSDLERGTRTPVLTDGRDSFELYACLPAENTLAFSRTLLDETESLFAVTVDESGEFGSPRFLATLGKNAYPVWGARNGNIYFRYSGSLMFNALVDVDAFAGQGYSNLRRTQGVGINPLLMGRWSPDGRHVAGSDAWSIKVLDEEGKLEKTVARPDGSGWWGSIAWSPSADRIIVSNPSRPEGNATWLLGSQVFDLKSGGLQSEVPNKVAVAWLADESGFVYVSDDRRCLRSHAFDSGASADIWCTDVSRLPHFASQWAQSADGHHLAFVAPTDSAAVIHSLNLSTGRLDEVAMAKITPGQPTPRLQWSLDGRRLFFYRPNGTGGTTYDLPTGTSTEWSTGGLSDISRVFALHPSGRKAIVAGSIPPPEGSSNEISILYQPAGLRPPK